MLVFFLSTVACIAYFFFEKLINSQNFAGNLESKEVVYDMTSIVKDICTQDIQIL